jgi:anti-sigma factor RsiW
MKPCRRNKKLIAWFALDELGPHERAELVAHLRECKGCQSYLEEMRFVSLQLNMVSSVAANERAIPCLSGPLRTRSRERRARQYASPSVGPLWRLAIPGFAILALALLVVAKLERTPVDQITRTPVAQIVSRTGAVEDSLPTLSNYRAAANESLDKLDQLLTRQAQEPVSSLPPMSPGTLALINMPD